MDTWIVTMVRARCRRRVGAWLAAVGGVVLFGLTQIGYIEEFATGPHEVGDAELMAIRTLSEARWHFVRVTGSKSVDTGFQEVTVHKTNGVETSRDVAGFYALTIGEKWLIYKSAAGNPTTIEGELEALPADLQSRLFANADMQAIRGRFLPFYVSDRSFRMPGYVAIGGLVTLGLLLAIKGRQAWKYLRDPASHPVAKRVAGWGDPVGVAMAAERDARAPRHRGKGGWKVSDQFLMQVSFFSFDLLRVSDLLWGYKKITRHSVNFVPTGKTFATVLACYGGTATILNSQKKTDALLSFVVERVPWAIIGYTKELEQAFAKQQPEFRAAVEQRKHEWTEGREAPKE